MDFPQSDSDRGELLLGFARVGGAWLPDARGPSGLHFGRSGLVLAWAGQFRIGTTGMLGRLLG